MQKVTPFLWFDNNAEEAMEYYTSIFKDSRIVDVKHMPDGKPGSKGSITMGTFEIQGQHFHVLNGGPEFKFTEAISIFVNCETQEEVDDLWTKLTAGGEESVCGWLKDKYGLSWQIVPKGFTDLTGSPDREKAQRAMQAMMKMRKLDMAALQKAYDG